MGEITEYLKDKYLKNHNGETKEHMNRQKVKGRILSICDTNLKEAEDVLTFEVFGKDLVYAVSVINEEPIVSKYLITQISDTLFEARMKEVDI